MTADGGGSAEIFKAKSPLPALLNAVETSPRRIDCSRSFELVDCAFEEHFFS